MSTKYFAIQKTVEYKITFLKISKGLHDNTTTILREELDDNTKHSTILIVIPIAIPVLSLKKILLKKCVHRRYLSPAKK